MIQKIVTYVFAILLLSTNLCIAQSVPHAPPAGFPFSQDDLLFDKHGALDPNKSYTYDQNGCISTIEEFDGNTPLRSQRFFWTKHQKKSEWLIRANIWEDGQKNPLVYAAYKYDERGNCIKETFYINQVVGKLEALAIDDNGNLVSQANTTFSTMWTYSKTEPARVLTREEESASFVDFSKNKSGFWDMYNQITNTLSSWHDYLSFEAFLEKDSYEILKDIFGENMHILLGICESKGSWGIFNPGVQINPKVKLTAINGILNLKGNLEATIDQISQAHGNNQIYYVYRPTEGWTRDIYGCVFAKMGFVSPSAQALADLWRRLIKDMGGANGGGTIVHYAHSIGSTDTLVAGTLLTPEERAMIHVVAIGSPSLYPHDTGFKSIKIIASVRDFVAFIGLVGDPIRYANAVYDQDNHIQFVGTHWGIPIIDHLLSFDAYREIIENLGEEFLHTYGEKSLQ